MSINNLVTVTFSEPVLFKDYDVFVENLKTNINGPSSPYTYSFSIETIDLVANTTFTEFDILVFDIQASILGENKERFEIWFNDLSVIQDPSNNTLSEGNIVGYLNFFEYISPEVADSASNGGSSMKYTIISMFSINLLLKTFISSSAALMWSLIHVLQVFRYILMMNIKMPALISILMEYLAVVIGEIDEVEEIVPDVFNTYIVDSDALNQDALVLERFEENGYDSPFLTDLYGKQILMIAMFIFVAMPIIFVMMKIFKNVP